MSAIDGGPAFPVADFDHQTFRPKTVDESCRLLSGMSLRDYFAAAALTGFCSACTDNGEWTADPPKATAEFAYKHADAMLAARSKP